MAQNMSGTSLIGKIGSYLQIVTKDPRSTAFVPLAEAYRQVGLLDDALEAARMGTRSLPHFSPGFATMGRVLGQMGRIDEAMGAFAQALSIDRQSQAALIGLARLHLIRGERDQARKILQQAAEFHPRDENVRNMLVALDLPRPWDKLKQVQVDIPATAPSTVPVETGSKEPESIFTATLAEIYVKQGLTDKAIAVYEEILKQDPDSQFIRERLNSLLTVDEPKVSVESGSIAVDSGEGAVSEIEEVSVAADQTAFPRSSEPSGQSPLAVLERWLSFLKQRREHVQ
ncbi:MAG: tetratricopeptide repeat protein [Desulfuromonadales bacterium]|nr:tetratricopeptide repeat protein [Desulfuromonadales bacterium]